MFFFGVQPIEPLAGFWLDHRQSFAQLYYRYAFCLIIIRLYDSPLVTFLRVSYHTSSYVEGWVAHCRKEWRDPSEDNITTTVTARESIPLNTTLRVGGIPTMYWYDQ